MQSAAEFQSSLDRMLAARGQPATLQRRNAGTVTMSAALTVFMRGYTPQEIVDGTGIVQGDSLAIMSTTDLINASWPGGSPRPGDFLLVGSSLRRIVSAPARPMGIGYDLQCRG